MADDNYYQKRAWKRLAIIAAVVVIVGGGIWYAWRAIPFEKISALETSAKQIAAQELANKFSAPAPLIATTTITQTESAYTLTREGVIVDTNEQRALNGNLPPLAENATLDDIASLRLDDMFAKQYFAHISPSSSSAVTVANAVGYDYITLGENLALGNFDGDQGVIIAWMNSPGHRANILNTGYTQIGVAVGDGVFQGNEAWIAVQVFGKPTSACPLPDSNLDAQITGEETQITQLEAEVQLDESQINAMNPKSGDAYNQAVAAYNALVNQYNSLVAQAKPQVADYNAEVAAYNTCVGVDATTTISIATSSQ